MVDGDLVGAGVGGPGVGVYPGAGEDLAAVGGVVDGGEAAGGEDLVAGAEAVTVDVGPAVAVVVEADIAHRSPQRPLGQAAQHLPGVVDGTGKGRLVDGDHRAGRHRRGRGGRRGRCRCGRRPCRGRRGWCRGLVVVGADAGAGGDADPDDGGEPGADETETTAGPVTGSCPGGQGQGQGEHPPSQPCPAGPGPGPVMHPRQPAHRSLPSPTPFRTVPTTPNPSATARGVLAATRARGVRR